MMGCMGFDCSCPTHPVPDSGTPQSERAGTGMNGMHRHGSHNSMAHSGGLHIGAGCTDNATTPSLATSLPPDEPASLELEALASSSALPILTAVLHPGPPTVGALPQPADSSRYLLFAALLL